MKKIIFFIMILAMPLLTKAQDVKQYYIYNIIEFPTRYELHNLCEYDLSDIHVTRFFDEDCKVSQFKSCTRNIESKSFYFNNLYLNCLVLTGH